MAHEILLNGGDSIDEGTLQTAFATMGKGRIEQDALGIQYYDSDDTIDTEAALARVPDGNRDIPLFVDAITGYQLEANAVNNVWLAVDPNATTDGAAVGLAHNTTGVAPTDPHLLIAEVDTNKTGADAVTLKNRGTAPGLDGADINPRSVGREQPAEDVAAETVTAGTLAAGDVDASGTITGTIDSTDGAINDLDANSIDADSVVGIEMLHSGLTGEEVTNRINSASSGTTFVVEPGASWHVTDTLRFPAECTVFGNTPHSTGSATFAKGFDGTLCTVDDYSTFHSVAFRGDKADHTGHCVEFQKVRDCLFNNCLFARAAGDGLHQTDGFFNTFVGCHFQRNDGWGVWLGNSENPHNQWLGPCYIGRNSAGGVFSRSHGRNQQWLVWCGNNGGPGFELDGDGFNGIGIAGQITGNAGPGILVSGGSHGAQTIRDTVLASNAGNPDSSLTAPVGQIHMEGGGFDGTFQGVQAYGHGTFISSLSGTTQNHSIAILSAGNDGIINGAIRGPDTIRLYVNSWKTLDDPGKVNVEAGIGVQYNGVSGAPGAIINPNTGTELYQRA